MAGMTKYNPVKSIIEGQNLLYLSITGGGLGSIGMLTENGGASSVFVGASVPYSQEVLASMIGSLAQAVTPKVARLLSLYPFNQPLAFNFGEEGDPNYCVSIGVTASLAKAGTEREGREHKVYIHVGSFDNNEFKHLESIGIQLKDKRTRLEEETLLNKLILSLADCRLNLTKPHPLIHKPWLEWIGLTDKDVIELDFGKVQDEVQDTQD
jgi:hypothetical protein